MTCRIYQQLNFFFLKKSFIGLLRSLFRTPLDRFPSPRFLLSLASVFTKLLLSLLSKKKTNLCLKPRIWETLRQKMFYSQCLVSRKGPLGAIWVAAYFFKKLKKAQVKATHIPSSVGLSPPSHCSSSSSICSSNRFFSGDFKV